MKESNGGSIEHPSPLQWAVGFALAWLVGWTAVMLYTGSEFAPALERAVPMAIALGVIAYLMRTY